MAIGLRATDIAVLQALLKDGRKSFRQISRESGISTPTVKARFNRLVNMGVIKSISPIIDLNKVEYNYDRWNDEDKQEPESPHQQKHLTELVKRMKINNRDTRDIVSRMQEGMIVKLKCDYCKNLILAKQHVFKFANYERFFCCKECKLAYKKKHGARIQSIIKKQKQ
jgi:DNA-binding Lrp family transcriptional regulator